MRKLLKVIIIILLIPIYLILFAIVHELGHTLLARLMGDPTSIFYLIRIDGDYMCLGCNIYDQSRLTWGANLVVSLGGLLATQVVAITALFLLRLRSNTRYTRRILGFISLGFAFLDVIVQVAQGLLYNLNHLVFPSNVDLVDVMLLIQQRTGTSQLVLKAILLVLAVVYLSAFVGFYWRNRWAHIRQM